MNHELLDKMESHRYGTDGFLGEIDSLIRDLYFQERDYDAELVAILQKVLEDWLLEQYDDDGNRRMQ